MERVGRLRLQSLSWKHEDGSYLGSCWHSATYGTWITHWQPGYGSRSSDLSLLLRHWRHRHDGHRGSQRSTISPRILHDGVYHCCVRRRHASHSAFMVDID